MMTSPRSETSVSSNFLADPHAISLSDVVESSLDMQPSTARTVWAPSDAPPTLPRGQKSLFLSGSIDGPAPGMDWRAALSASLAHLPITIYNPLRPDWDATWVEDISFTPFREQVEWELAMLERADVVAVYFSPHSEAPITLLELGLLAHAKKAVVAWPKRFWRRGNVQIVCARYGITMVEDLEDLVREVKRRMTRSKNENELVLDEHL